MFQIFTGDIVQCEQHSASIFLILECNNLLLWHLQTTFDEEMILKEDTTTHLRLDVEFDLVLRCVFVLYSCHRDGLETFANYCESFIIIVHICFENHSLFSCIKMKLDVLKV